jgi:glycosylphosphatidylinositol transamidase (GPIT) subunit GPI8
MLFSCGSGPVPGAAGPQNSTPSAYRARVSRGPQPHYARRARYAPAEKTGLWALILATTKGWSNYRHQADALAHYNILRSRGVPDDHIVLILAGDVAGAEANPEPGVVRNRVGGKNLAEGVEIDYRLDEIRPADVLAILSGRKSARLPRVIESRAGDNIDVFLVGHGDRRGLAIEGARGRGAYLTPSALARTLSSMYEARRYRRVFVAVEACFGGAMGAELDVPGVILFAGANPRENSVAANYDLPTSAWLADEFAFGLNELASRRARTSMRDLYAFLQRHVEGSHVSVYNTANFGNAAEIQLREFVEP